jgi:hypothetical protein
MTLELADYWRFPPPGATGDPNNGREFDVAISQALGIEGQIPHFVLPSGPNCSMKLHKSSASFSF